jgi:hypothetical protein
MYRERLVHSPTFRKHSETSVTISTHDVTSELNRLQVHVLRRHSEHNCSGQENKDGGGGGCVTHEGFLGNQCWPWQTRRPIAILGGGALKFTVQSNKMTNILVQYVNVRLA